MIFQNHRRDGRGVLHAPSLVDELPNKRSIRVYVQGQLHKRRQKTTANPATSRAVDQLIYAPITPITPLVSSGAGFDRGSQQR